MRIGSLFSGIGGLELGLERAGVGHTVWQVEIEPYCRSVLTKHWPKADRFNDVKECSYRNLAPVDLICGGFPCQDVSSAGKRAGLAGARSGLWWEYLIIVSELGPEWVVVENVASGASLWTDTVLNGLGELGYACLPIPIAAADVGAPHLRKRIFIVAHLDQATEPTRALDAEVACAPTAADTDQETQRCLSGTIGGHPTNTEPSEDHWRFPMSEMVRVVHGVSRQLDSPRRRIGALGNSVVPQCAEVIGHVILELIR